MKMILYKLLFFVAALYAGFALLAWLVADKAIFQPHPAGYRDTPNILKLTTATGKRISAVHIVNPAARYTLLLISHGNAEDLGDDLPWFDELRAAGFSIFAYDYEGYGTSEGSASEQAFYDDETAAYRHLREHLNVPPGQIIVYGRSVGGGPAVYLASREPVGGLVLESTFLSAFRVLTRVPLLPFDRFPNYKRIRQVRCPVLIMHGVADDVISKRNGEQLYALANQPKRFLWIEGAGHNDFAMIAGKRYIDALKSFVATL